MSDKSFFNELFHNDQTLDIQLEAILEPPSGINGPSNALEWLEPSLLNEELRICQFASRIS